MGVFSTTTSSWSGNPVTLSVNNTKVRGLTRFDDTYIIAVTENGQLMGVNLTSRNID